MEEELYYAIDYKTTQNSYLYIARPPPKRIRPLSLTPRYHTLHFATVQPEIDRTWRPVGWHDTLVIVDVDGDGLVEVHVSNADLELFMLVRTQDAGGERSISLTPLLLLQQMTVCWHAVVFWQT